VEHFWLDGVGESSLRKASGTLAEGDESLARFRSIREATKLEFVLLSSRPTEIALKRILVACRFFPATNQPKAL
jgi:hypothetical protein